ncbi:MAG: hypothetical protein V1921_02505 [Candidatus Altiarchaeota archaeon]
MHKTPESKKPYVGDFVETLDGKLVEVKTILIRKGSGPVLPSPLLDEPPRVVTPGKPYRYQIPSYIAKRVPRFLYNDPNSSERVVFEREGDEAVLRYRLEGIRGVPVEEVMEGVPPDMQKGGFFIREGKDMGKRSYYELGVRGKLEDVHKSEIMLAQWLIDLDRYMRREYRGYKSPFFVID